MRNSQFAIRNSLSPSMLRIATSPTGRGKGKLTRTDMFKPLCSGGECRDGISKRETGKGDHNERRRNVISSGFINKKLFKQSSPQSLSVNHPSSN